MRIVFAHRCSNTMMQYYVDAALTQRRIVTVARSWGIVVGPQRSLNLAQRCSIAILNCRALRHRVGTARHHRFGTASRSGSIALAATAASHWHSVAVSSWCSVAWVQYHVGAVASRWRGDALVCRGSFRWCNVATTWWSSVAFVWRYGTVLAQCCNGATSDWHSVSASRGLSGHRGGGRWRDIAKRVDAALVALRGRTCLSELQCRIGSVWQCRLGQCHFAKRRFGAGL